MIMNVAHKVSHGTPQLVLLDTCHSPTVGISAIGRKRSRLMRNALMYLAADIPCNVSASETELATAMGEVGCFGSSAQSKLKMLVPATRMGTM